MIFIKKFELFRGNLNIDKIIFLFSKKIIRVAEIKIGYQKPHKKHVVYISGIMKSDTVSRKITLL